MKSRQELGRENQALRHRISSLSEAMLRMSASPAAETVLHRIAENARALTGARYAVITSFDDAGQVEDCVTSGLTPDEQRPIEGPDGMRLFEHLRSLPSPVRLRDLRSCIRSIGLSTDLITADTFLGLAICHRNERTGTLAVAGKEGGEEFTREDEEILVLFAAQAGMAIATARTDRDRQRVQAFLETVSHELRAPLSSIKGLAATALDNSRVVDPHEVRQFFRIIEQQADDMDVLTRDLLDAGRIETGTLPVAPERADVSTLVDHARRTFLGRGFRHVLAIDLPPDLPRVMADEQRIVQVLNNLFSYAARNSPQSSPIRVTALHEGAELAISVSDEALGVAPDRLPHLFRKHAAGGETEASGLGLGLAICKGLVEAHGGRIRAESLGPDQGTRIAFTLPVVEDAAGGASARRPDSPRDGERTGILVVDDDPLTLRLVRQALVSAGFATSVTGDPRELPHLISTRKPRLVLLDLVFPNIDGIALMESVPALADLPVIFISGYGRDETIARALEAGAADYIVKPFSATELTARVRAALRTRTTSAPFLAADLAIDYERRRVTVGGRTVRLTVTEYELLRVLSVNAGRVLTYDSLLLQVWGERVTDSSEPVRTFVKKLRGKLGDDAASPSYIFNERGVGYRMIAPGDR